VLDAVVADVLVEGSIGIAFSELGEGVLLPRFALPPVRLELGVTVTFDEGGEGAAGFEPGSWRGSPTRTTLARAARACSTIRRRLRVLTMPASSITTTSVGPSASVAKLR